jgi:hypothetical protein
MPIYISFLTSSDLSTPFLYVYVICDLKLCMSCIEAGNGTRETVTEPRMTEPRKTEPRKTERRKDRTSKDRMSKRTEHRKTEPRMGPNIKRLNVKWA